MLKIAAEGVMPLLMSCIQTSTSSQNACQRLAPLAVTATQKCLSQSQTALKKYIVKDHYEFDQKVSTKKIFKIDFYETLILYITFSSTINSLLIKIVVGT